MDASIIAGGGFLPHPKHSERQRVAPKCTLVWQTVCMQAWMDFEAVSGVWLRLVGGAEGLRAIDLHRSLPVEGKADGGHPVLREAARQIRAYFTGGLREFRLPLDPQGTTFQLRVWRQLLDIPYGETRSYAWLAEAIGAPKAVRAVGAANGANPLAIVVPCHRVIGSNGSLTGYGGGLPMKRRLLALERGEIALFEG